ncbi:MAG: hypothetical protein MK052_11455 [Alphaproteobacteria bacterium]|nr:hypothetical protein [Alphaproteobacteria bacterium]
MAKVHDIDLDAIEWPDVNDVPDVDWREEWRRYSTFRQKGAKVCIFVSLLFATLSLLAFELTNVAIICIILPIFTYWIVNIYDRSYKDLFRYGELAPAIITKVAKDDFIYGSAFPKEAEAAIKLDSGKIIKASSRIVNPSEYFRKINDKFPPKVGDKLIVFYCNKHPHIFYPVSSQFSIENSNNE